MKKISIQNKFDLIEDLWNPRIIAQVNGQDVKVVKVKGEFIWHNHKDEDELFYILKGQLIMEFRDKKIELDAGEMIVVPKGIEHRPIAQEEVWLMLFEPSDIRHTGDVRSEFTKDRFEHI